MNAVRVHRIAKLLEERERREQQKEKAAQPRTESWGCVAAIDFCGRTTWIADAHRDDGMRFIVHADDKLSAFAELEREVLTVTFYLESNPFR